MALRDHVVTANAGLAYRIIWDWITDKSGRLDEDVLRDLIVAELDRKS